MALPSDQWDELRATFPGAVSAEEDGFTYILLEKLILPPSCLPTEVKALLCPLPRDGYPSRLFLSEKVNHGGQGQNWNAAGVVILGEKWWAVSWDTKSNNERLVSMIGSHLQAFRP